MRTYLSADRGGTTAAILTFSPDYKIASYLAMTRGFIRFFRCARNDEYAIIRHCEGRMTEAISFIKYEIASFLAMTSSFK